MSNYVFPDLPLIDIHVDRERLDNTSIYEGPGGTEQRVSWYAAPRYRYRIHYDALREYVAAPSPWDAYSELGVLRWFLDQHRGPGDSFLFNVPGEKKNLLAYSQDFSQATWSKNTGVTVTPNTVAAPDGTTTADTIAYAGGGLAGDWRLAQTLEMSIAGGPYSLGAWLRAGSALTIRLGLINTGTTLSCALATAWQRFTLSDTGDGSHLAQAIVESAPADNAAWTIYGWGFQLERTSSAGLYVPTGANPITGQVRVRFEEDTLRVRRIVNDIYEVEFNLITVAA